MKNGKTPRSDTPQDKSLLLSGALRRSALAYLSRRERMKYEIAQELGLLDKVRAVGWAGLSAKEPGRIGGLIGGRGGPESKEGE